MNRLSIRTGAGIVGALAVLLSVGASSALAKEGVSVNLSAPLPREAEPGTTVPALFTMEQIVDDVASPLHQAAVFLRLYGPTGAMTEAAGVEQSTPGLYKALIEIPAGGVARGEFGIHGAVKTATGKVIATDPVWAYDGVLVAAAIPDTVDPNTFQVPLPKAAPVNPADAAPAGAAQNGQTASDGSAAASAIDPRWAIAGGVVLLGAVAAGWAVGRRRMSASAT